MSSFAGKIVSVIQPILSFLYNLPVIGYYIDLLSLCITASFPRFACGHWVANNISDCHRPKKLLKLYEYEGCPFCRKVRETLCVLDLDVIIYPCPRETFKSYGFIKDSRYRKEAKKLSGKAQFPLLIDENPSQNVIILESDKIIDYLWTTYGDKATLIPSYWFGTTQISFIFLLISSILRSFPENGLIRIPSKKPKKLLELYSFEPSPFCKKVREILSSLEIAYISRNIPRGSLKRPQFKEKYGENIAKWRKNIGAICVPFLIDPNTGIKMFESEDIKQYLIKTYQDGEFTTNESISGYFNSSSTKSQ